METIERLILEGFFPWLASIATFVGLMGIIYVVSSLLTTQTGYPVQTYVVGISVFGWGLYFTLRHRAVGKRIKKLLEGEAANIALAGSREGGINRDALGIIERRVYKKLCSEGLAKEGDGESSPRITKKISRAIIAKYEHLKGIH